MSSRILGIPQNLDWKQAYMAAILEKDRGRIWELIQNARVELARRLIELQQKGPIPCGEAEAIQDACYMLHALESSLSYRKENDAPSMSA
jgi:hypothetical protein